MMRLEIGPGRNPRIKGEDVIYIDRNTLPLQNLIIWDLNKTPLPFSDHYFREIWAFQTLEHVYNLGPLMNELHRIIEKNGIMFLEVPHIDWELKNTGPSIDHTHYFSEHTFKLLYADYYFGSWKIQKMKITRNSSFMNGISKPGRIVKNVKLRKLAWLALNFWKLMQKRNIYVELMSN